MISERSIVRSVSRLGFHIQGEMQRKRAEGAGSRIAETDQQHQVTITGEAAPTPEWETIKILFAETIFVAPSQRTNPVPEPHFTFGSTMQSDTPVILHATVDSWIKDSSGNFIGANVAIAATGGSEESAQPFKATIHLTFQGLSGPEYPTTDAGEG